MDHLRYPVGKFHFPDSVSAQELAVFIDQIAETPARMRDAVAGLSESQLATPYRPGGWTVRQLAHHVPDSHINSYTLSLRHPELGAVSLENNAALYAWHGRHHVAHIFEDSLAIAMAGAPSARVGGGARCSCGAGQFPGPSARTFAPTERICWQSCAIWAVRAAPFALLASPAR